MKSEEAVQQAVDDLSALDRQSIDWQEIVHAVRERLWILILFLVLAAIATTVYLRGQKQEYQARSVLFIEQEASKVLDQTKVGQEVHSDAIVSLDMINTVVDLLRSFPFAERVASRMKLQKDPRFLALLSERPAGQLTTEDAAAVLQKDIVANYRLKTRLIDIFVTMPDPLLATDVANTYADEYIRYGFDTKDETNRAARQYLLDESERLSSEVRKAEQAMQNWREGHKGGLLDENVSNSQNKIAELNRNISDLENKLLQLDNDLKVAAAHPGDNEALLNLPSIATQPKVADLNSKLADLDNQFTLVKQRYRAKHPAYISVQTQLISLRHDRDQVLQDAVNLLKGQRQQMQAQHDDFKNLSDDQRKQLLGTTGQTVEYNELKRTLDTSKALYDAITVRLAQVGVSGEDVTSSPVKVYERATGAPSIRASTLKLYIITALLGLGVGLGTALALHFMDKSVKTIDQAERLAGVPVLTAVPRKARKQAGKLDIVTDREGVVAESFRTLRTSLAMVAGADERRVFMFTSAVPSEGKTFCSSNFAVTLAQQGYKTLIIDGDLRRPMVSRVFFGEQRRPGLVDVLLGEVSLNDAAMESGIEDLKVLTAGNRAVNPAELLAKPQMLELIKEASLIYDRIVLDTAPVLAVSDSLLLAPLADVTCLVLRSFKTPRKTFVRAAKSLSDMDCRVAGVVFNFMPTGFGSYYYYSGKYHGDYGTKGVYGT